MTLGLIGCGRMGRALALGALGAGAVRAEGLLAFDINTEAVESFVRESGSNQASSLEDLGTRSDVILLCTKPHNIPEVLATATSVGGSKLAISIAAGVTVKTMEEAASSETRVIRCMPNTPALVSQGAAAFTLGSSAGREDAKIAEMILGSVGQVVEVEEHLMDVVTGLSGSGPAYIYLMIEALTDAAILQGLDQKDAQTLAVQTVLGAATMVKDTGLSPAALREMVSSPGGTTLAGLKVLEDGHFRDLCQRTIDAATHRSRELGAS